MMQVEIVYSSNGLMVAFNRPGFKVIKILAETKGGFVP